MARKSNFALSRLKNFAGGAKQLIEHISPCKPCKKAQIEDKVKIFSVPRQGHINPNQRPSTPISLMDEIVASTPSIDDVFTCGPQSLPRNAPQFAFFQFQLPDIGLPHNKDGNLLVDDTDNISCQSGSDQSDNLEDDDCSVNLTAPGNSGPRDGHLCKAPTVEAADKALDNLHVFLCGPSKGQGGGYKPPLLDPFM